MRYFPSFLLAFATLALPSANGAVSPQCLEETKVLQSDSFLGMVQGDLYNSYQEDFEQLCDFSKITEPDCGLEFDGDNKTYVAACADKGGQVLNRPVVFKCGYSVATINIDLGYVPTCIGASCDASMVEPHELNDTKLEQFLWDISIIGCDADFSAGVAKEVGAGLTWVTFVLAIFGGWAIF